LADILNSGVAVVIQIGATEMIPVALSIIIRAVRRAALPTTIPRPRYDARTITTSRSS